MEQYVYKEQKKMRMGYTTGSCAAAAAAAAARMLLGDTQVEEVTLGTPKGIVLNLEIIDTVKTPDYVRCGVKKDAGDDPDVTDGVVVYAVARKTTEPGIVIDGGIGVGRVTKPGLDQPVGAAAISHVPRQMIKAEVERCLSESPQADFGISIVIEIPRGVELAASTFNPRLGIEGGISVLGTSGIVEPMSEDAIRESIRAELSIHRAAGERIIYVVPGNYGLDFVKEEFSLTESDVIKCSNYIGDTIDMAVTFGFEKMVLIGHIGKLVKLSGGIMNTHSRIADSRMELLAVHALRAGVESDVIGSVLEALTVDEALRIFREAGVFEAVMNEMMKKIKQYLQHRAGNMEVGVLTFSNVYGICGRFSV